MGKKLTRGEFDKRLTKIHNKRKKLEDSLDFSELSTYTMIKTVVEINEKIPNLTVDKYIEAIKKPELKEILVKLKKTEDEWHELRENGHEQDESQIMEENIEQLTPVKEN